MSISMIIYNKENKGEMAIVQCFKVKYVEVNPE